MEKINQGAELGSEGSQLSQPASPSLLPGGLGSVSLDFKAGSHWKAALGVKLRCGGWRFPRPRAAPTPGTPSHVPPPAPAAPGSPTVAHGLNYFLVSTHAFLICLYTEAGLPVRGLLRSPLCGVLCASILPPLAVLTKRGSQMEAGAVSAPERFRGAPGLAVGKGLQHSDS